MREITLARLHIFPAEVFVRVRCFACLLALKHEVSALDVRMCAFVFVGVLDCFYFDPRSLELVMFF